MHFAPRISMGRVTPRRAAGRALAMLAATLFASAAPAGAETLSLAQAEALLLRQTPGLAALMQKSVELRHQAVAAGQLPDPRLSLDAVNLPSESLALNRQQMTMLSVGVSQSFPPWGKRPLERDRTETEARAALAERGASAAKLTLALRQAWLDAVYDEQARQVVAVQQRLAAQSTQASLAAYRVSQAPEADVLRSRLAQEELVNALSRIESERVDALARIAQLLGLSDTPDLDGHWPELPAPPSLPQMLARLPGQPALRAAQVQTDAARLGVAIARRDYYPEFTVSLGYGQSYYPGSPNWLSAGVEMNLPIFPGKRQDQNLAAAQAQALQAQYRYEDKRLAYARQARSTYARYEALTAQWQRTEGELLPTARHAYEATLAAYTAGRMDMSAVLKAQQDVLDMGLTALRYRRDLESTRAELDYLATQGETQ